MPLQHFNNIRGSKKPISDIPIPYITPKLSAMPSVKSHDYTAHLYISTVLTRRRYNTHYKVNRKHALHELSQIQRIYAPS